MTIAKADAPTEQMTLLMNFLRNSSRTFEVLKNVSGERPSDCHPLQLGMKSTQGMRWPCVTSRPSFTEVERVQ